MDAAAIGAGLSTVGVLLNVVMFLSQIPVIVKLVKEGSSELYSWAPPAGLLLTTGCWLGYALCALPTPQVIGINALGALLGFSYLVVYGVFAKTWTRKATIGGFAVGYPLLVVAFYGLLFGGASYGVEVTGSKATAGFVTTALNTSLWASPLQALWGAARELDTSRVSVPLSFLQLAAASVWGAAGVVLRDETLQACSFIGVGLSAAQIGVLGWIWAQRRAGATPWAAKAAAKAAHAAKTAGAAGAGAGAGDLAPVVVSADTRDEGFAADAAALQASGGQLGQAGAAPAPEGATAAAVADWAPAGAAARA